MSVLVGSKENPRCSSLLLGKSRSVCHTTTRAHRFLIPPFQGLMARLYRAANSHSRKPLNASYVCAPPPPHTFLPSKTLVLKGHAASSVLTAVAFGGFGTVDSQSEEHLQVSAARSLVCATVPPPRQTLGMVLPPGRTLTRQCVLERTSGSRGSTERGLW